ncbi:hypothetical protein AGMMS49975_16760 [Clostridia bacterium]|nr:hypothetical protein AGMMS49975_16760 [Clostridia bacterium]
MDLYGLIWFIDETALPDEKSFYARYFRKPENYGELTYVASRYCFRTLHSQVAQYVGIPRRIPVTVDYKLTAPEHKLEKLLEKYLKKSEKQAFPKMDNYELSLMMSRTLSSSTFAFEKMLSGVIARVPEPELVAMQELAEAITVNAKGRELLKVLKKAFVGLKKLGANRKALVFTENLATQKYLVRLLDENGYSVLTYNGDTSRNYDIIRQFEVEADILVATDIAAERFHLAFCSFVVNYDLPYNVLGLEQRIMRCNRQGQKSDVIVLNFLNRQNFADVRMLELVNKRVSQFDGIFGMSDDVTGNFCENAADGITFALEQARSRDEIARDFSTTLEQNEDANTALVREAEDSLFTTFTKEVAEKVTITPQYIKDKTAELNDKLWQLTKWFFTGKSGYMLIEETRTLRLGFKPQKVFTGVHLGRDEYSIDDKILPKSGRYTIASSLTRSIINEIYWRGTPDDGDVTVDVLPEPCRIGYYKIKVMSQTVWNSVSYCVFVGMTASGRILTDDECCRIMEQPVLGFSDKGTTYGECDGATKEKSPNSMDKLVNPAEYIQRASADIDEIQKEELESIERKCYNKKQALIREVEVLKSELRQIELAASHKVGIVERVAAEKKKVAVGQSLKRREQTLFLDGLRLEQSAEEEIKKIVDNANFTTEVYRYFSIRVSGGNTSG